MRQQAAEDAPGPGELLEYWPVFVRLAWFGAGALLVGLFGVYVAGPILARIVRRRNRNNRTIQEAVSRYFQVLVAVGALSVGAALAGYTQLLVDSAVVVAAVTLAIGVAAQTVVGSFVSGLVLVLDPEFNVGDYIKWDGGEGTVRSITLRVTRVQTPSGEYVTIPNTVLTSQTITRPYGHRRSQVTEQFDIAYEDDITTALTQLEAVARELDGVLEAPDPTAYVEGFASDGVRIQIHFWVEASDRRDVLSIRSTFDQCTKERFERAGVTISPAAKRDLCGTVGVEHP
jgi:small-conductance mechanosensitive channel